MNVCAIWVVVSMLLFKLIYIFQFIDALVPFCSELLPFYIAINDYVKMYVAILLCLCSPKIVPYAVLSLQGLNEWRETGSFDFVVAVQLFTWQSQCDKCQVWFLFEKSLIWAPVDLLDAL
jgi:hypothetical protein